MAFDGSRQAFLTSAAVAPRAWRRDERLVVLAGAVSIGAMAGFFAAMWAGRLDFWMLTLIALPVLALDLHLTGKSMTQALDRRALGCAAACGLHAAAVIAWPMTALLTPLAPLAFWTAPALAVTALVMFASCWGGESRALYRMSAQGALVAALMAQQGVFVALGS